jgi:hypothetical protein
MTSIGLVYHSRHSTAFCFECSLSCSLTDCIFNFDFVPACLPAILCLLVVLFQLIIYYVVQTVGSGNHQTTFVCFKRFVLVGRTVRM